MISYVIVDSMTLADLFYTKEVLGKNQVPFRLIKVRTMIVGADRQQAHLVRSRGVNPLGKIPNDPRITSWGRMLRRYGIDETPQIVHVIRGQMSLVGIGPKAKDDWSLFPTTHVQRALVYAPGLCGITYAYTSRDFQDLVEIERDYLERKIRNSLRTDAEYLARILVNVACGTRSE